MGCPETLAGYGHKGELFAAVNNGSNSVAVYRRNGDRLTFERTVTTSSAPVSIDFANGHMYVAGATTVDSFVLRGNSVGARDGTTALPFSGAMELLAAIERSCLVDRPAPEPPNTL